MINATNRLFLKSSKSRERPPAALSPILVALPRPGFATKFGNRELLEPNTPFAASAPGTALARNFASAPGAADTRFGPPTRPPREPPSVGGGVNERPRGLGDPVTDPEIEFLVCIIINLKKKKNSCYVMYELLNNKCSVKITVIF